MFSLQFLSLEYPSSNISLFLQNWFRFLISVSLVFTIYFTNLSSLLRPLSLLTFFIPLLFFIFLLISIIFDPSEVLMGIPSKLSLWFPESNLLCLYVVLPMLFFIHFSPSSFRICYYSIYLLLFLFSYSSSWFGSSLLVLLVNFRRVFPFPFQAFYLALSFLAQYLLHLSFYPFP